MKIAKLGVIFFTVEPTATIISGLIFFYSFILGSDSTNGPGYNVEYPSPLLLFITMELLKKNF